VLLEVSSSVELPASIASRSSWVVATSTPGGRGGGAGGRGGCGGRGSEGGSGSGDNGEGSSGGAGGANGGKGGKGGDGAHSTAMSTDDHPLPSQSSQPKIPTGVGEVVVTYAFTMFEVTSDPMRHIPLR
jgi:hypothetical protein